MLPAGTPPVALLVGADAKADIAATGGTALPEVATKIVEQL